MVRLMSDLIVYLRDLLVFKAKPDVLDEDIDPDLKKSLAADAELIATDRLLELIDQLAAAEGRMKWVPNKKLHFEVAIIRAIQSLGQATLDEVIQKLEQLRDGEAVDSGRARPQPARRGEGAPTVNSTPSVGDAGPVKVAQKTGGAEPGYSKPETMRVAEIAPPNPRDAAELWQRVLAKIPGKGFLRTLSQSIHPIGIDGRHFLLGHSPDDRSKVEALASANNRRQLETLLREASGRDWSVRFVAKEGILPSAPDAAKPAESFKDDPLIQEAIELFKAQVRS
jgi:DNA polymerase-3 subunit gamma/tau